MKPQRRKVAVMPEPKPVDPTGRVDILFYRLAEAVSKRMEARFQMPGIWSNFVEPIAAEKVKEYEGMGPVEFARAIGFLKPERKKRIAS